MHKVLVNSLSSLSLTRNSVSRLTDWLAMTLRVLTGGKTSKQTNNKLQKCCSLVWLFVLKSCSPLWLCQLQKRSIYHFRWDYWTVSLCISSLFFNTLWRGEMTNLSFVRSNIFITKLVGLFIWAASRQNQQNDVCAQQRLRSAWASA